jgi:hypothetical protein
MSHHVAEASTVRSIRRPTCCWLVAAITSLFGFATPSVANAEVTKRLTVASAGDEHCLKEADSFARQIIDLASGSPEVRRDYQVRGLTYDKLYRVDDLDGAPGAADLPQFLRGERAAEWDDSLPLRVIVVQCIGNAHFRLEVVEERRRPSTVPPYTIIRKSEPVVAGVEQTLRHSVVAAAFESLSPLVELAVSVRVDEKDRCANSAGPCVRFGGSVRIDVKQSFRGRLLLPSEVLTELAVRCTDRITGARATGSICGKLERIGDWSYRFKPALASSDHVAVAEGRIINALPFSNGQGGPLQLASHAESALFVKPPPLLVTTIDDGGARTQRVRNVDLVLDRRQILPFWGVVTNGDYLRKKAGSLRILEGEDVVRLTLELRDRLTKMGPPSSAIPSFEYAVRIRERVTVPLAYSWFQGDGAYLAVYGKGVTSSNRHLDLVGLEVCLRLTEDLARLTGHEIKLVPGEGWYTPLVDIGHGFDRWLGDCNRHGRVALADAAHLVRAPAGYDLGLSANFPSQLLVAQSRSRAHSRGGAPVSALGTVDAYSGYPAREVHAVRAIDKHGERTDRASLAVRVRRLPDIRAGAGFFWNASHRMEAQAVGMELNAPLAYDLVEIDSAALLSTTDSAASASIRLGGLFQFLELYSLLASSGSLSSEVGRHDGMGPLENLQLALGGGYDFGFDSAQLTALGAVEIFSLVRLGARYVRVAELNLIGAFAHVGFSH